MCANSGLAIYLCLLLPPGATSGVAPPEFDHHHAIELNEAAFTRLLDGKEGTARILLERAAVLTPDDTLIAGNLAALRDHLTAPGVVVRQPLPPAEPASVPAPALAPRPLPEWPVLPAPWPAK